MSSLVLDKPDTPASQDAKAAAVELLRPYAWEADKMGGIPAAVRAAVEALDLPGADGFAAGVDDAAAFCATAEALAWGDPGIAYAWLASRQVAWVIASCGTEAQKAKWLPRLASDPFLPASLYLHEGRGLTPSEFETQVRRDGEGFLVNGYKSPVMYPQTAVVSVVVGRDEAGALAALVVEGPPEGVAFKDAGGRRLALRACPNAIEARISNLRAPAEAALRPEGLLRAVTICRLAHAAVCVGAAAAATRYAGEWALKRVAFGKPIISYQAVAFPLVNLVMDADAARLSIVDLTRAKLEAPDLERQTNQVVAHANQLISDAGREGIQMMGVHGVLELHPQEGFYRSAAVLASIDFDPLNCELVLR